LKGKEGGGGGQHAEGCVRYFPLQGKKQKRVEKAPQEKILRYPDYPKMPEP